MDFFAVTVLLLQLVTVTVSEKITIRPHSHPLVTNKQETVMFTVIIIIFIFFDYYRTLASV
jgi:hypothetical protein